MIRKITTDDLRRMENKEGLILQDCGGDLQEWQDGINDLLTKENILLDAIRRKCKARHRKTRHMETQISQYLRRDMAVRLCSDPSRRFYRRTSGTAETGLSADRSGRKYI